MDTPLKKMREQRDITLIDLANAVGCSHSTVSRVENGAQCSPELAEKLSKFFGGAITELQILYPERFV